MSRRQHSASSSRPPSSSSSRPFSRGTDAGSEDNSDRKDCGDDFLRSQGYSLHEIVNDRSFPLDANLLHTIVSSLTHCAPRDCIVLPEFRLQELFSLVSRAQYTMLSEGKLTESFVSFSVLCLYTTLSSNISESFLLNWMLLLQHMICESLVIVQNLPTTTTMMGKADAQQMQQQSNQRAVFAPLPDICQHDSHLSPFNGDLFDIFFDCVFYVRLLLKDSFQFHSQIQQLQEISAPKDFKTNLPNKLPDSMKAVHIYMMSVASFAHCTLTLSTLDAINSNLGGNNDTTKNKIIRGEMISGGVNGLTQRLSFVTETLLLVLMTTTVPLKEMWCPSDSSTKQSDTSGSTKNKISSSLTIVIQQYLHSLINKNNIFADSDNNTSNSAKNSDSNKTHHSRHHFFRTVSFDASIVLAQRVSQVVLHVICDNNTLQVLATGKKRFLKNVSHPELPLLLFKTQSVAHLLEPENNAKQGKSKQQNSSTSNSKRNSQNNNKNNSNNQNLLSFVQVLPITEERFHVFNQLELPLVKALLRLEEEEKRKIEEELSMEHMKTRLEEESQYLERQQNNKNIKCDQFYDKNESKYSVKGRMSPQGANRRNRLNEGVSKNNGNITNNNTIIVKAFINSKKKEKEKNIGEKKDVLEEVLSSDRPSPAKLKRSPTKTSIEQNAAALKKQFEKKLNHFNLLKKSFRELFLVFDCLSILPATPSDTQDNDTNVTTFVRPLLFISQKGNLFETDFDSMVDKLLFSKNNYNINNNVTSQYQEVYNQTQQWRYNVFAPDYRPILLYNPLKFDDYINNKDNYNNNYSYIHDNDNSSTINHTINKNAFLSKRSVTEQVRHFEALCLHMYQPVCRDDQDTVHVSYRSRVADPLQPVCHVAQCVLEYLWQLCREDRGLCRTRNQQISLLNKQITENTNKSKQFFNNNKNNFLNDNKNNNPNNMSNIKLKLSSSLPVIDKNKRNKNTTTMDKMRDAAGVSLPAISRSNNKSDLKSQDLAQRLSQAKQLAHLEAKLHSLQSEEIQQDTHNNLWSLLQEQYFSKQSFNDNDFNFEENNDNDQENITDESKAFKAKYSQDLSSSSSDSESETDDFDVNNSIKFTNKSKRKTNNNNINNTNVNCSTVGTLTIKSIVWFHSKSHFYNVRTGKHKHTQDTNPQNPKQSNSTKMTNKRDIAASGNTDAATKGDFIRTMIQQHIFHANQQQTIHNSTNNGDNLPYYEATDHPLRGLPLPVSLSQAYATHLQQHKHQETDILSQKVHELQELQAKLVAENKVFRQRALLLQRQQQLEELQATQAVQQEYDTRRAEWKLKQATIEAQLKETKLLRDENEKFRINDIQNMKRFQEMKNENEKNKEMQLQSLMISFVTNAKEHEEDLKRLREEENMRNEEAKRFLIEQKQELKRQALLKEQVAMKERVQQAIARNDHRVRRGHFVWHNGRFGFYDNVRSEDKIPAYIQYTDEHNLYYDPLTNSFLRRKPLDADITTYTDEARNQYDAIYGAGAYDAYHADLAFKLSVNEHGGYYDNETGEWQVAYGYFDPEKEYEWVPYEGYYDESTGKFIKYAKVQGDLSFMV